MAYNSLKRIFGETRLELKLLLLFGVGLLVIIATGFYWYGASNAKLVKEHNRTTAHLLVDQYIITLHWRALDPDALTNNRLPFIKLSPQQEQEQQDKTDQFVQTWIDSLSKEKFKPELIRPSRKEGPGAPKDDFERKVCEKYLAMLRRRKMRPRPARQANSPRGCWPTDSNTSTSNQSAPNRVALPCATLRRWAARRLTPTDPAFPWPASPAYRTAKSWGSPR